MKNTVFQKILLFMILLYIWNYIIMWVFETKNYHWKIVELKYQIYNSSNETTTWFIYYNSIKEHITIKKNEKKYLTDKYIIFESKPKLTWLLLHKDNLEIFNSSELFSYSSEYFPFFQEAPINNDKYNLEFILETTNIYQYFPLYKNRQILYYDYIITIK